MERMIMDEIGVEDAAVVCWNKGAFAAFEPGKGRMDDVRLAVFTLAGSFDCDAAELTYRLEACVVQLIDGEGRPTPVRSFRMRTPAGHERYVCLCGRCGHLAHIMATRKQEILAGCPVCHAVPAGKGFCRLGHTWGECGCCEGLSEASSALEAPRGRKDAVPGREAGAASQPKGGGTSGSPRSPLLNLVAAFVAVAVISQVAGCMGRLPGTIKVDGCVGESCPQGEGIDVELRAR